MLKEMVEFIVKKIVDNPETVVVTEANGEQSIVIELRVATSDLGKVIGKDGRTARSLRILLQTASAKSGKRAVLEILE